MFDNPGSIHFPRSKAQPIRQIKQIKPIKPIKPHAPYSCRKSFKQIFRFKITLERVEPTVWRRIEVPDCYTFWDFHVAIADAFEWLEGMKGKNWKPDFFDPAAVHFDDPAKRWKVAFEEAELTPDMRCWDFFKIRQ